MVAPLFGASYVPPRVRIVLALALTVVAAAADSARPHALTLLSADGVVTTAQQIVIGVALGFALQLMFDALTLGGQLLANGMGLGFAFNVDPLRGVETPALGQLYVLLGTLTFLALNGHIALIETLVAQLSRAAGRARRACRRRRCMRWPTGAAAVSRRAAHRAAGHHRAAGDQSGVRRHQPRGAQR